MVDPFDKHKFSTQPLYYKKEEKFNAREQVIKVYRDIKGEHSIPLDRGYWTLCNKQPNVEGAEIVQLVKSGLIQKNQFFGVDYDLKREGIIESNRLAHPEANWFKGDWLEVIEENYDQFKRAALIYLDSTRMVVTGYLDLARTMNTCPAGTMVAANFGITNPHSGNKKYDPDLLVDKVSPHLRRSNDWKLLGSYYSSKCSRTEMATYIFWRD